MNRAVAKAAQAAALASKGVTWDRIVDELGYKTETAARNAVTKIVAQLRLLSMDEDQARDAVQAYDDWLAELRSKANQAFELAEQERDVMGMVAAVRAETAVATRAAMFLGLDKQPAASNVAVTSGVAMLAELIARQDRAHRGLTIAAG